MSVYVDNARLPYEHPFFGMLTMCHMVADTETELHEMAGKIGVQRKWFQNKSAYPHYDICLSKRKLAIEHGAKKVSTREIILIQRTK